MSVAPPSDQKWKQISDHPDYYINKNGDIWSAVRGNLMTGYAKESGGICVEIDGKPFLKHQLLCQYWLPNPNHYSYVSPIDGNYKNLSLSNWTWSDIRQPDGILKIKIIDAFDYVNNHFDQYDDVLSSETGMVYWFIQRIRFAIHHMMENDIPISGEEFISGMEYMKFRTADGIITAEKTLINRYGIITRTDTQLINIGRPPTQRRKFLHANIFEKGNTYKCSISLSVALTFLPNPYNLKHIQSQNGEIFDPCVWNLQWCGRYLNNNVMSDNDIPGNNPDNWRYIPDHPNYMCSKDGKIWSCRLQSLIQGETHLQSGHKVNVVSIDGVANKRHRVIAKTWIPNPDNLKHVYVRDGNWDNLSADNLIWSSPNSDRGETIQDIKNLFNTVYNHIEHGIPIPKNTNIQDWMILRIQNAIIHMKENCLECTADTFTNGFEPMRCSFSGNLVSERYEINPFGIIRYVDTDNAIFGHLTRTGYTSFMNVELNASQLIHRMVALTFIPNPENKPQVNHINSIRCDPCLWNLEWVTQSENMRHVAQVGSMHRGTNHHFANKNTTEEKVHLACKMVTEGKHVTVNELSEASGLSQGICGHIKQGRAWTEISSLPQYKLRAWDVAPRKEGRVITEDKDRTQRLWDMIYANHPERRPKE